jgi:hypothetical protein
MPTWHWYVSGIVCAAALCVFVWAAWPVWNYKIGE